MIIFYVFFLVSLFAYIAGFVLTILGLLKFFASMPLENSKGAEVKIDIEGVKKAKRWLLAGILLSLAGFLGFWLVGC